MEILKVETRESDLIFVQYDSEPFDTVDLVLDTYDLEHASAALGGKTSSELCELLDGLIVRLEIARAPNEEKAIEKLSIAITQELGERIRLSEKKKAQRNELIRYLRDEIKQLKNKLR